MIGVKINKSAFGFRTRSFKYNLNLNHLRNLSSKSNSKEYDVTIIGGGSVGSVLANLLSERVPSLKVSLIDARTPKSMHDATNIDGATQSFPSPRAYALSPKSLGLLGDDIMDQIANSGRMSFYDSMQIWESDGPSVLQFTHDDLNADDKVKFRNQSSDILGAVVEDEPMVSCLWDKLRSEGEVDLISPAAVTRISAPDASDSTSQVEIDYQINGDDSVQTISTNLLVAADGGNSFVRRTLGTYPTMSYAYGRKAVTCTVEIDSSIGRTAFQRCKSPILTKTFQCDIYILLYACCMLLPEVKLFLTFIDYNSHWTCFNFLVQPNGPIALLPIWNEQIDARKGNCGEKLYANIVWSTVPEEAKSLMNLDENAFIQKLNDHLQSGPTITPPLVSEELKKSMPKPIADAANGLEFLSQTLNNGLTMSGMTERRRGFSIPPMITGVVGRTFSFDLNLMHAKSYVGNRVALVGDAAHTIHPMAGQGLNLGLADADCLVNNLNQAIRSGMGIDVSAGLEYALQQYETSRQQEVIATMGGIQFLHGAFGTTFSPAVHARSIGMNIINSAGPVRRKLARIATGMDGIN